MTQRRNVERLIARKTTIAENFDGFVFHTNYLERLSSRGILLNSVQMEIVLLTASAFRIVDDILDEHEIRDGRQAFWTVHGITRAVYVATLMTVKAWNLAEEIGLGQRFLEMFRRVVVAVEYELLLEDGMEKFESFRDWLRAAERETAFREFLAYLAGVPERALEFRLWGLQAQVKDDLIGSKKEVVKTPTAG